MRKNLICLLILSVVMLSCGPGKTVSKSGVSKDMSLKKVHKAYLKNAPRFKTINARLRGTYDNGRSSQSVNLTLRMQKDEVIWISAKKIGIPLAKLMITPDSVRFYEKINGVYFDGDFSLLTQWLGVPLDFEKVQNLLTGRLLYEPGETGFHMGDASEGYLLVSDTDTDAVEKSALLDPYLFHVLEEMLLDKRQNRRLQVTYPSYKEEKGIYFPDKIDIIVQKKEKQTGIHLGYRSLEFNKPVSFPFEIPKGYQEIEIK